MQKSVHAMKQTNQTGSDSATQPKFSDDLKGLVQPKPATCEGGGYD